MLNILQIEDRLKDMSEDVIKRMVTEPNSSVPPFLATNELNRRDRMRKEFQMRQAQDVPTVAEQLVAGAGMPNEAMSQMAMNMAPKSDIAGNTGLEAMMPKATMPETEEDEVMLMEDEDPMGMSYGGLVNSRAMVMSQPLMRSGQPMARPLPFGIQQQQRDNLGFKNLGSNIVNRIGEKSQGEVDEFIGEVRGMADDRFDLDLNQQPQFDTGGKGFSPLRPSFHPSIQREDPMSLVSLPQPMYRREGGQVRGAMVGGLQNLLNPDGTIKEEFEDLAMTADGTVVTGGSPYERDENRTQMTTTNQNDNNDPPPPKTTAVPSSFDNILSMIQEDRESAKEQRDRDRYLALMQFGLNLAKRGQLEDTGEGLKTLAMSNKAYQDQLGKLRGMDIQAMLTKENIAGRERAAGITAQAALERALAKGGLDEKELANLVDDYASRIQKYDDQLGGVDGMTMSPQKKQEILELRRRTLEKYNYYDGLLESKRGSKDITKTVYGG